MSWTGFTDKEIDEAYDSKDVEEALEKLNEARQKLMNDCEKSRVKAGNAIMNWLTEHFIEHKRYYKEEYGSNWEEAMEQDLVYIIEDKEFNELVRKYFEYVIGV